ncbi:MAG: PKD domain-containing protein [Sedimentisphaerales bacterium]|nr:PKD domain-containing protein [Sedimentisphaerales bacterium]
MVTGPGGSSTKTVEDYIQVIQVTPPPDANFTATPRSGISPLVVKFTDTSTGNISGRLWNFGDGTTSKERDPSHTYEKDGSYTVSLTVTGPGGSSTKMAEDYIQANSAPIKVNINLSKRYVFRAWSIITADITVTKNDQTNVPVAGATIKGSWEGCYGAGTTSGLTNANGAVSLRSDWTGQETTVTFTINSVIIDGKEYSFVGKTSASIGT